MKKNLLLYAFIAAIFNCNAVFAEEINISTPQEFVSPSSYVSNSIVNITNDISVNKTQLHGRVPFDGVVKDTIIQSTAGEHYTVSGNEEAWGGFRIASEGTNVTYKNLTFKDFIYDRTGFFNVASNANLNLENVIFDHSQTGGNPAVNVWGGILDVEAGGKLSVNNSTFKNNNIWTTAQNAKGGVIFVQGNSPSEVRSITNSTFENNTLEGRSSSAYGGALYIQGIANEISGSTFKGNSIITTQANGVAQGGAIATNNSTGKSVLSHIRDTEFIGNSAIARDGSAQGGAIYVDNGVVVEDIINVTYTGNSSAGRYLSNGGAIYNNGTIKQISGSNFEQNLASSFGGAIYNGLSGQIEELGADFSLNMAQNGGAILNQGSIDSIKGSFSQNYAESAGGAIYNAGTNIGSIEGDFSKNVSTNGAAIENGIGNIGIICNSKFDNNISAQNGAAIDNSSVITNVVNSTFSNNIAYGRGGAINNDGVIENLNADFTGNSAYFGGAIANLGTLTINSTEKDVTFSDNIATSGSGADIYILRGKTVNLIGDNINNKIVFASGNSEQSSIAGSGDINNLSAGTVEFIGNTSYVDSFTGQYIQSGNGITRLNNAYMFKNFDIQNGTLDLQNGSYLRLNDSFSQNLNDGVNIIADGNSIISVGSDTDAGTLKAGVNLDLRPGANLVLNNGSAVLNNGDNWQGKVINKGGNLNIVSLVNDSVLGGGLQQTSGLTEIRDNSQISINDKNSFISGGDLSVLNNSSIYFGPNASRLNADNLLMANNSSLLLGNGVIDAATVGNMQVYDVNNLSIDISPRDWNNDKIVVNGNLFGNGTVNVSDFNFIGKAPIDRNIPLKVVDINGNIENVNFTSTDKAISTPIGSYRLYSQGGGNYVASLRGYNPQVFRGQVATVAQWMNQLSIDDMLFTHSMVLPSFKDADGGKMSNNYASVDALYAPYQYSRKDGGLWYKMYGTFEHLEMSNGLKSVGNNSYGTLIGADFGLKDLKNGWKFMPTAYIGYNGAHQYWSNVSQYQNGGQAGFLGTWYKNNFIVGAMAYGGVYGNTMDVNGYTDDTFNYFGGTAAKASYNIKVHRDFVIQPNLLAAYNYFGQQNWHTDFGDMGMMAGMLNGVNIAPGVNFIWERETFSAYLTLQYMFNINGASGGRAGNVNLSNLEMERGYIQYGLGLTKRFSDRFSGYLQAVLRNAGRTGVGFQAGFLIRLGK